jgi:dihydropyrimidinase
VLAPGSDADIVVWDPAANHTISAKTQHQRTDYNLYEGMKVTGVPAVVLSRGRVLVQGGQWQGEQGAGRFIARQRWGAAEAAIAPARAETAVAARNGHKK